MTTSDTRPLKGKTALVTGASSGLGRHFARVLARAGAAVALAARRVDALDSLAEEIRASGGHAAAVRLDVTDASSVRSAVAAAWQALGAVDILVNNSGVTITKPVLDVEESEWDSVLDTNLKGAFLMSTEVARRLRDAKRPGTIVNIASILGLRQGGAVTPYAVSKAGLVQLTKQLALELARYGIRVNALAPGYVETDINRDFFETDAGKALVKRIPQRHLGRETDLDGALLLLASDTSSYMTGSVVTIDGGHLVSSV